MAKFSSPLKQSSSVMRALQGSVIRSVGTVRNYEQALTRAAEYMRNESLGSLRDMSQNQAVTYLNTVASDYSQSTVDMARQAIQSMMQHITDSLEPNEMLPRVMSENPANLSGRAYTTTQMQLVSCAQTERHSLATQLCYAAGLRAHEILTLRPAHQQPADPRPADELKFSGREGKIYTTTGKGGLTREIMIPKNLVEKLETLRLDTPRDITDRGINYTQHYKIGGGKNFSNSFSSASQRALGWSAGAHGLRHSYAQNRMRELQKLGIPRSKALLVVSQELGHFRPEITEVYLR